MTRIRIDQLLVERGLAPSRAKARQLVLAGRVELEGRRIDKPGAAVDEAAELRVEAGIDYVSRGGHKLAGALADLGVEPQGLACVDIGASTGGFTDCLLQQGAAKVYAVDVGHDLLDARLAGDPRVIVRDGTNARHLTAGAFDDPIDLVVVDASFIGIDKLLPAAARLLPEGGQLLALVKPQFEQGAERARQTRGVIRDAAEREALLAAARKHFTAHGFVIEGECDSRVAGPKGNVERFIHARRAHD